MKCPQCNEDLHICILDDRDIDLCACQVICPKHGELLFFALIKGEPIIF